MPAAEEKALDLKLLGFAPRSEFTLNHVYLHTESALSWSHGSCSQVLSIEHETKTKLTEVVSAM